MCIQFNDRRGHRRLRLTSRKHFKPKPRIPKSLCVSISRQHVSVLKVSLPIELVNFCVSLPITSLLNAPALTVHDLYRRLQSLNNIPQGKWYYTEVLHVSIFVRIK